MPTIFVVALLLPTCGSADERMDDVITQPRPRQWVNDLRRQISGCWSIDLGIPRVADMQAEIGVDLNPDASVASVEYTEPTSGKLADPNYRRFAESARRAILTCSPLQLPKSVPYETWKHITFTFNPREMLGQ